MAGKFDRVFSCLEALDQLMNSDDDADSDDDGQAEDIYHPAPSDTESECEDDPEDVAAEELPQPGDEMQLGKDGTVWYSIPTGAARGRTPRRNIFTDQPGPTVFAKARIQDELTSFLCLLNNDMLEQIKDYTVQMARSEPDNHDWDLSVNELKAFISVFFLSSLLTKDLPVNLLWQESYGNSLVKKVMSRDRFKSIMRYLRFDDKNTREARKVEDKFAAMSGIWNQFTANCQSCFVPGVNITVDEQLFPSKARCGFTQYMASKPDKFGIKFWVAADLETKYFLNGFPYLGKGGYRTR